MNRKQRAKQIKDLFGQEAIDLVTRRHRGGQSGAKGVRYEDYFAIYRLASLAREFLEEQKDSEIAGQVFAFVDDLEILKNNGKYKENYQIKNSSNVVWGSGKESITDAFLKQYRLNSNDNYVSVIKLIVSDLDSFNRLQKTLPSGLDLFSKVEHFSYYETLSQYFNSDSEFREIINYLCARPDQIDKIETVASAFYVAWLNSSAPMGDYVKISDLVMAAKKQYPSYIRIIGEHPVLRKEVAEILNAISDFSYLIERGFFSWEYLNGLESGVLTYDCSDSKFDKFQKLILKQIPASFDQLEGLLL